MQRSNVPNYIRIHDAIKEEVEKAVWKIGERLPSERDLAERFGVSRMTARQAVTSLVEEGILERRVGAGRMLLVVGCVKRCGAQPPLQKLLLRREKHRQLKF